MPEESYHSENSEELSEIVTKAPSWILKGGISIIFITLVILIGLSAFIQYPDVIKTSLKISSLRTPKAVVARQSGNIVRILISDNQLVAHNQPLAYMESTASHEDVIRLFDRLNKVQKLLKTEQQKVDFLLPNSYQLGELQPAYEMFYQSYLQYINAMDGGHLVRQRGFLKKDLKEIKGLEKNIGLQGDIQKMELANAEQQYKAYKTLYEKGVISKSEFKQEESKYFASKHPLQQTAGALLNNASAYLAKQREILDLEHSIAEQKFKFTQALNSIINETSSWLMRYVLFAPVAGRVGTAGIIQEYQHVNNGDELFIVNPGNNDFFGQMEIPQYNMGKVLAGQRVLVKLHSYPFEEFGLMEGKVTNLSTAALKDSIFTARIEFRKSVVDKRIKLKNGMIADAEIVAEESTLLQRLTRNIRKILNHH